MSVSFGTAGPGGGAGARREPARPEPQRRCHSLLEPLAAAVKGAPADAPLACRIRAALGRAERRERDIPRALELGPAVESCKDPAVRVPALYVLAGATVIPGDCDRGVAFTSAWG